MHEMARGERPYAAVLVMHVLRAVAAADCRGPSEREPEATGVVRWHGPCDEDEDSDGETGDREDEDEDDGEEGYTSDGEFEFRASDGDETTMDDMDYDAEAEAALSDGEEAEEKVRPGGDPHSEVKAGGTEARAGGTEASLRAEGTDARTRQPQTGAGRSIVMACLVRGDAPLRR